MKVLKFGGTSVGSAERIKEVARLVTERGRNIVVLSAMAGTTNTLVSIADAIKSGDIPGALGIIGDLSRKYRQEIEALLPEGCHRDRAAKAVGAIFADLQTLAESPWTPDAEKEILSKGELMSTAMMHCYLQHLGVNSALLPALDFMRTDANGEPDAAYIRAHLSPILEAAAQADLFITQGFICRNSRGGVDNLQRGGSDYTASLLGAAVQADEVEIWTDIDGMHNNDPRFVDGTSPVEELHFEEAAELAYFGAKILHPTCVLPAKKHNIPVRLLNTMCPEARGTVIYNTPHSRAIKAVAAKDGITAIKIKSSRMLLAYGFLRKVFEIFETHHTSIDMIVTSEVGVSVTIDNEERLPQILAELEKLGTVTVDRDMVIVCVVGDLEWQNRGFEAKALDALRNIPVRMISYGGSNYNISFLIRSADKVKALKELSKQLFEE